MDKSVRSRPVKQYAVSVGNQISLASAPEKFPQERSGEFIVKFFDCSSLVPLMAGILIGCFIVQTAQLLLSHRCLLKKDTFPKLVHQFE